MFVTSPIISTTLVTPTKSICYVRHSSLYRYHCDMIPIERVDSGLSSARGGWDTAQRAQRRVRNEPGHYKASTKVSTGLNQDQYIDGHSASTSKVPG